MCVFAQQQACWMVLATIRDLTSPNCGHHDVLMFASITTPLTIAVFFFFEKNGC